jgi:hypothetical protein
MMKQYAPKDVDLKEMSASFVADGEVEDWGNSVTDQLKRWDLGQELEPVTSITVAPASGSP